VDARDCGYCPQAANYHTEIEGNDLMSVSQVKQALRAKSVVHQEFVWRAAWRNVKTDLNLTKFLKWFVPLTNLTWKFVVLWYDH
jgi:biotin synthase